MMENPNAGREVKDRQLLVLEKNYDINSSLLSVEYGSTPKPPFDSLKEELGVIRLWLETLPQAAPFHVSGIDIFRQAANDSQLQDLETGVKAYIANENRGEPTEASPELTALGALDKIVSVCVVGTELPEDKIMDVKQRLAVGVIRSNYMRQYLQWL